MIDHSDAILGDIEGWIRSNTSGGHYPLPKALHDQFHRRLARYEKCLEVEGEQQLSQRITLEQIWKMVEGRGLADDIIETNKEN